VGHYKTTYLLTSPARKRIRSTVQFQGLTWTIPMFSHEAHRPHDGPLHSTWKHIPSIQLSPAVTARIRPTRRDRRRQAINKYNHRTNRAASAEANARHPNQARHGAQAQKNNSRLQQAASHATEDRIKHTSHGGATINHRSTETNTLSQ